MSQDPEKGQTGMKLSQLPKNGYTTPLLHKAVENLDFEAMCTLIKTEDINTKDQDGNTVLHKCIAVIQGNLPVSNSYIVRTEYVNDKRQLVTLPERNDVISILLDQKNIDPNSQNNKGETPLHLALVQGKKQIISLFLSSRSTFINLYIRDNEGKSCEDLLKERYPEMILFHLLYHDKTGRFINMARTKRSLLKEDDGYNTFLQSACEHRSPPIVRELLDLGVDPNGTCPTNEKLPSKIATEKDYPLILRIILEYCYNSRETDDGNTVIHLLIKQKDSPPSKGHENSITDQADRNSMIKCLLREHFYNVNAINEEGQTVMHLAIANGNEEIISILLSKKEMDLDGHKYEGKSFREILEEKYPKILLFHFLYDEKNSKFEYLARTTKRNLLNEDDGSQTFLQYACEKGSDKTVQTLLDLGVNPIRLGTTNRTPPFTTVISKGFHKILKIFLECPRFKVEKNPDVLFDLLDNKVKNRDKNPPLETDYNQCLELLLCETRKENKLDINRLNKEDETILQVAMDCDDVDDDFILKLLDADIFIGKTDKHGRHTLERLDPSILRAHFDNCISAHKEKSIQEITFNYRSLVPPTKMKSSNSQSNKNPTETDLLQSMCRFAEFKKLLKHPLITSFLNLKWFAVRKIFYINLIFYFILCFLFTAYVSSKYVSWSNDDLPEKSSQTPISNVTETSFLNSTTSDKPNIAESESHKWLRDTTAIFWVILFLRELVQLCISPLWYLKSAENWLEMTAIVTGAYILFQNSSVNYALVAVAALTSWSEAVLLLGRHPKLSIYIQMFKTVILNFLRFLFMYCPLIVAFALSFCFLFSHNMDKPSREFFVNPFIGFFKIFIMMTGEYDSSNFDFETFPLISHVVFILFVFLIAIVLLSLLNGLAVGDIQKIRLNAELSEVTYRIKMYQYYENMPILNLLSNMFDSLINVVWLGDWIHAKLKILKSWFTVVLFPDVLPTYKAYIYPKYDNVVYFAPKSDDFFNKLHTSRFQRLLKWQINSHIVVAAKMRIEEKSNSIRENTMEDLVEYCAEQLKLYKPKLEIDKRNENRIVTVQRISKNNEEMLAKCYESVETIGKQLSASIDNISERLLKVEKMLAHKLSDSSLSS